ncbi:MAG: MFS transporter, partial [bacterium]
MSSVRWTPFDFGHHPPPSTNYYSPMSSTSTPAPADHATCRAALTISMIGAFQVAFLNSSVNVALPAIGREFDMHAITLSWVAMAMILTSAVFVVPFGRIADIYGRKRFMIWGTGLFTLGSLACALSINTGTLLAARALQGIGTAMIFGTGVAILTSVFPPEKRGKALGYNVAAVYMGLSAGPFMGGLLTGYLGWRALFWINVPLGLLVLGLLLTRLNGEWNDARGERFDVGGSLLFGSMVVCIMYGLSIVPALAAFLLIALGLALLTGFVIFESRQRNPVLDVQLFRKNTAFAFSNLAAFINYSAAFTVSFLLSLYLQYVKGLTPLQAGLVLMAQPVVMGIFSPIAGRLSDRIEPAVLASAGMALTTLGLTLMGFIDGDTSLLFIIAVLLFIGAGFALFSSPNTNAIMTSIDRR